MNGDGHQLISRFSDRSEIFFYIDPPYVGCDQGHYGGYTRADFSKLIDILKKIKGKFILSHYYNEESADSIDRLMRNNNMRMEKVPAIQSASIKSRERVEELLIYNYNGGRGLFVNTFSK